MLTPGLMSRILEQLGVQPAAPTLALLDALVTAYTKTVPWESASRIVRRRQNVHTADCPRWPAEFWESALQYGTGGTCYESNLAFFALLHSLGYGGYGTINDMEDNRGCHSALVVIVDGARYLVDVGLPLHLPIPLQAGQETTRQAWYHRYVLQPQADNIYAVLRDNHPKPTCYTLIDTPVSWPDYRAITINDYGENGLFLDRVIVTKVCDGVISRFNDQAQPYQIEAFLSDAQTRYHYAGLTIAEAVPKIAAHFGLCVEILTAALEAVKQDDG